MAGLLADAPLTGSDPDHQVKCLATELLHRGTVEIAAGIHVHFVAEQIKMSGVGHELDCRHKRKIGDGAIAGGEKNEVAAAACLTGDAFQIVAGTIHEIEARHLHRLGVFDDIIDPDVRIFLAGRADRFQSNVIKAAEIVAPARISFDRVAVPTRALLEAIDGIEKGARRRQVFHIRKNIRLSADEFIGLGKIGAAAVADQFLCHPSDEWISGDTGESIRAAALQPHAKLLQRLRGTWKLIHRLEPGTNDLLALIESGQKISADGPELMEDMNERVIMSKHEFAEARVIDKLNAQINGQHGSDVRMSHESGERSQDEVDIVWLEFTGPFRVGDR